MRCANRAGAPDGGSGSKGRTSHASVPSAQEPLRGSSADNARPINRGRRSPSSSSSRSSSSASSSSSNSTRRRELCRSRSNSGGPPTRLRSSRYWAIMDRQIRKAGYRLQLSSPASKADDNPEQIDYSQDVFPDKNWDLVRRANRVKDGKFVIIRRVLERKDWESQELEVIQYLNTPELRAEKHNHTVRLLDVLYTTHEFWSCRFIVMEPSGIMSIYLADEHLWKTPDSWLDFVVSVFEVYAFLHLHEIAHVDIAARNILIHPKTLKITVIDFEASKRGSVVYTRDLIGRKGLTLLEGDIRLIGDMFLTGFQSMLKRYPIPRLNRLLQMMRDTSSTGAIDSQVHKNQMKRAYSQLLRVLGRPQE